MNLQQLIDVADKDRDQKWEDQFLQAFSDTKIKVLSPDPQEGPDGWPYLMVETGGTELSQKVMLWLAGRGIGLVINPTKDYPDFVLSYGMLWSFRETGRFIHRQKIESGEAAKPRTEKVELAKANIQHAGAPTPEFLPLDVRKILKDFFRDQGILQPRVLVLSYDRQKYELAFSLESLGNPPEKEWPGIAEALAWFLPPHYSLLLISEKGMPSFVQL